MAGLAPSSTPLLPEPVPRFRGGRLLRTAFSGFPAPAEGFPVVPMFSHSPLHALLSRDAPSSSPLFLTSMQRVRLASANPSALFSDPLPERCIS